MDNYQKILKAEELFLNKEYHGAKAILESLLEEDSENVYILNDLALIYAELGDVEKAVEYFERVLSVDPTFEKAFFNLLDLLLSHGHLDLVAEVYLKYHNCIQSEEKRKYEDRLGSIVNRLVRLKLRAGGTFDFGPPNGDEKAPKIAFVCGPNSDFLIDLEIALSSRFHVRIFHFPGKVDFNQVQDALDWADVVWFEWAEPILAHASNRLRKTAAVVCRIHRYEVYTSWFEKINWNFVDHLIITSRHIFKVANEKANFDKYEYLKVSIIPSFVDISKFEFVPKENGYNIAYLGYLNHRKNPSLLLQCIKSLVDIDSRYKLYIGGISQSDEIDEYIENLVDKLNLRNNVVFCGWIEDVAEWLKDKHYLILPSIHEGNPYCVLEAAACGVKPLIHYFPGAEQLYPENWLFSSVQEFVERVLNCNQNAFWNRQYIIEHYSIDKVFNDIIELLNNTVRLHKRRLEKIKLPKNSGGKKSVCIVTSDFVGIVKNGGIGTAYTELAKLLAKNGWNVTVLYANPSIDNSIWKWIDYYAIQNINIIPLALFIRNTSFKINAPFRALSYEVYQWLKFYQNCFDIIHFHEWLGLAYYTTNAKIQNLAFQNNVIIVGIHGPRLWVLEYNQEFPTLNDLEIDFMECESVKNADYVWFVNKYMEKWLQSKWKIDIDQKFVLPYVIEDIYSKENFDFNDQVNDQKVVINEKKEKKKILFFGRLEKRKGLDIFCDALSNLVNDEASKFIDKVVFLGKDTIWDKVGKKASDYVFERSRSWPWEVNVVSHLDRIDAINFIKNNDYIIVIPSRMDNSPNCVYECLSLNKMFIASNVGGIPEIISEEYHEKCLFEPNPVSLANKLKELISQNTYDPPKPAFDFEKVRFKWLNIHEDLLNSIKYSSVYVNSDAVDSFVSVCLVHHERPHYLANAIDSLLAQTYKNFEVVLVDDGSQDGESEKFLNKISNLFGEKGWKIIRQENKYLGAARNCAAKHARGEFLLFMDDDDFARPHELETYVKAATSSKADILTCVADHFCVLDDILNDCCLSRYIPVGNAAILGVVYNSFGGSNMFVKRTVFESLNGFKEVYNLSYEDWEFLIRASLCGYKICVVPEPLFWYRLHSNSMSHINDRYLSHRFRLNAFLENINPDLYKMMILTLNSVHNS